MNLKIEKTTSRFLLLRWRFESLPAHVSDALDCDPCVHIGLEERSLPRIINMNIAVEISTVLPLLAVETQDSHKPSLI